MCVTLPCFLNDILHYQGDKGYACESFLLTPLADPQTPSQRAYIYPHNKTRALIEITFGLLKFQFQCLHHLRVFPDRACDVIAACAVLHNIACPPPPTPTPPFLNLHQILNGTFCCKCILFSIGGSLLNSNLHS